MYFIVFHALPQVYILVILLLYLMSCHLMSSHTT